MVMPKGVMPKGLYYTAVVFSFFLSFFFLLSLSFKFLTAGTVKKVELHQCAKFHRNCLNRGRDT